MKTKDENQYYVIEAPKDKNCYFEVFSGTKSECMDYVSNNNIKLCRIVNKDERDMFVLTGKDQVITKVSFTRGNYGTVSIRERMYSKEGLIRSENFAWFRIYNAPEEIESVPVFRHAFTHPEDVKVYLSEVLCRPDKSDGKITYKFYHVGVSFIFEGKEHIMIPYDKEYLAKQVKSRSSNYDININPEELIYSIDGGDTWDYVIPRPDFVDIRGDEYILSNLSNDEVKRMIIDMEKSIEELKYRTLKTEEKIRELRSKSLIK